MNEDFELGMEITTDMRYPYAHVYVRIIKFSYGEVDYFFSSSYFPDNIDFCDLIISCQIDKDNEQEYAKRIEYRSFSVELARAERMVKTLKKINNGIERLENKLGYIHGFAEYVMYIADVLKIKHFIFKSRNGDEDEYENQGKYVKGKINGLIQSLIRNLKGEN